MRLATLLALLLAVPAAAQAPGDYAVFATQAELDDGGTLSGAVPTCLLAGSASGVSGAFFWDATSQVFAIYDAEGAPGERTSVPVAAFLIDLAAGTNVTTCRDAVPEIGPDGVPTGVAFLVLSDDDDEDFVARVDAVNQGFSVLTDRGDATDSGDGISGLAQVGATLYLARQQFFGAPEDGIYAIDTTTEEQVPVPFLLDADLDLVSVAYESETLGAGLYAVSSEFGAGAFENVVLYVDPAVASPEFVTVAAPCAGADPVFSNCDDGGLEAVAVGVTQIGDLVYTQLFVFNNAFSGPDGEVLGSFRFLGDVGSGEVEYAGPVFTESDLVAATGVSGYTPSASGGYLFAAAAPGASEWTLFVAGSDAFGGEAGVYSVTAARFVAAEAAPEGAFVLAVSPNPALGAARLTVTPEADGTLRVDVLDALGRTVATLFDGAAAAGRPVDLVTPDLAPGVYSVRVSGAVGVTAERFTVVR